MRFLSWFKLSLGGTLRRKQRPTLTRYAVAVLAVGLSAVAGLWLRPLTYHWPYLFFNAAILLSLLYGGFGPGMASTVFSALLVDYLFLPPYEYWFFNSSNLISGGYFCLSFGLICWLVDTRRDRAEDQIDSHLQLLEMVADPIIMSDEEDRITYWNTGAERVYGWCAREAMGKLVPDLLHTTHPIPLDDIKSRLVSDGGWSGELRRIRKDGSSVVLSSSWTLQRTQRVSFAILESDQDVTDQREGEEKLRASEEQFRILINTIPQLAWMANPDGWIFWYNQGWYDYTGSTPQQMEGWGWQSVHEATGLPKVMERWKASIASGKPFEMVFPLRSARGEFRAFLTRVTPLRDASGKVLRWYGTNTDVEEQKRTENKLVESQQRLTGIITSAMDAIITVDEQQRIVLFNPAAEKIFRCSQPEALGQLIDRFIPQRFHGAHTGHIGKFGVTNVTNRAIESLGALSALRIDGKEFLIEASISQVEVLGKKLFTVIMRDITERQLAELALRKSEERFRKAFRNSPLATTISTVATARYLDVNDAFLDLLGYQRQDVVGHTAAELGFWSEPGERTEMLRQVREDERVAKLEMRYQTAKGDVREAEVWAESIELDGQPCVLAIIRDVTELRKLEAQFRQAQKMESVGLLAGGVAHDYNNIMGVIIGYTDLSLGLVAPENPLNKYLSETKKAAQRAVGLTKQLLAFSRRQVVFPKLIDLNEVVRNATNMFVRLVGEDIAVDFRPTTPLGSIKADSGQIEQVLMNLVVNARDAMPTGGKIIIETGHVELDEDYVSRHPGSHAGEQVVLAVSDTGCGMDESVKSRIFDPFFTTKSVGAGTGLGLSTVYGIVKQSEGYLLVYSETGKGTTFKIYFPRLHQAPEPLVLSGEEVEPPRGSEMILVVEDDENLREITVTLLEDAGYRVAGAGNAEEALIVMAASQPEVDLLLTDVIMPGINGADLVKRAKEDYPKLVCLFMSGYTSDLVLRQGVLMEEAFFLEKPFSKRSLRQKVHSALHGEYAKRQ